MDTAILQFLAAPFAASLILTGIHTYLGVHVVERGVIFVDLSLAQIAALGATVAMLVPFSGGDPHSPGVYWFSLGFTFIGAAVFSLVHHGQKARIPQEAVIGIVYAVAFRVANNILVLWPLLTPLGSLFAQLETGDLAGELPWAAILGFADVLVLMAVVIWLAKRHERKLDRPSNEKPPADWFEVRVVGPKG